MANNAGYIGFTGASSTVIADISESVSVSGLVNVSGTSLDSIATKIDGLSSDILTTSAVSIGGSVNAAVSFPVSQNVSGISLDAIKVNTEAIETAVEGTLNVAVQPSTSSYLSHVYLDLDGTGDNPATNTAVVAAPGSGNKLVIYGIQGSIAAGGASDYGNWYITDGNNSAATTLWTGRTQGTTPQNFSITFPYGVALTANTAMKVSSTEGSGNIFINAVVYYRTEAT